MIAGVNPLPLSEEGDPPCWAHLLDEARGDIVDRHDIEVLVRNFYRDAAMDDMLGPVFLAAHVNWNAHVATLIDFWAWQLLGQPGYDGQPLRAHEPVHARTPLSHAHYQRWVELFCDTIDISFQGPRPRSPRAADARWRQRWNDFRLVCRPMAPPLSNRCGGVARMPDDTCDIAAQHGHRVSL